MMFNALPKNALHPIDALIEQSRDFVTRDLQQAYDTAIQVLVQVELLRLEKGYLYLRGMAEAYYVQAIVHFYRSEYQEAIDRVILSTEIFEELRYDEGLIRCWNMGGLVYRQLGDFPNATDLLHKALQLAETMPEPRHVLMPLNSLASLYIYRNEHAAALPYLDRALQVTRSEQLAYQHAKVLGNASACYEALKQYDKALEAGQEALAYFEITEQHLDQVYVYASLARAYQHTHRNEDARHALERALDIATRGGLGSNRLQVLYDFGNYYLALGDLERAKTYFIQVLNDAAQTEGDRAVYVAHRELAEIFKQQGDFELALDQLEQYLERRDAIMTEESEQRLQNLEIRLRTEQSRRDAEYYRQRTQELERLREQDKVHFEQISRIKEDLLNDTSHDLKNPLARIMVNASFLKRHKKFDEKGISYLEGIIESSKLMNDLVVEALELVRLEVGHPPEMQVMSLVPLIEEMGRVYETLAEEKGITLITDTFNHIIQVKMNPREIRRVMENLISNAIKYSSSQGTVHITVQEHPTEALVRVCDSGDGVSEDDIVRIFDRFYRSSKHIKDRKEGTGLGLAIVKKIVENHGGKIWVERVSDGGSAFCFTLPKATTP